MIPNTKICCVVVTYYPQKNLLKSLDIYTKNFDKIYIIDNTPEFSEVLKLAQVKQKVVIKFNGYNAGIAKALNLGFELALNNNYEWVVSFDQDSLPSNNLLSIFNQVFNSYPNKSLIGAIGLNASDKDNKKCYPTYNMTDYVVRDYLITSGCLISTSIYKEVGPFRDELFIDNVDLDYSLRIRRINKVLLISTKIGMIHKAGNSIKKSFSNLIIESSNHNPTRRYYMSRNNIILTKKYYLIFPYFIIKMNFFFIISLLKIMIVESDRKQKIKFFFKGFYDGLTYNLPKQ